MDEILNYESESRGIIIPGPLVAEYLKSNITRLSNFYSEKEKQLLKKTGSRLRYKEYNDMVRKVILCRHILSFFEVGESINTNSLRRIINKEYDPEVKTPYLIIMYSSSGGRGGFHRRMNEETLLIIIDFLMKKGNQVHITTGESVILHSHEITNELKHYRSPKEDTKYKVKSGEDVFYFSDEGFKNGFEFIKERYSSVEVNSYGRITYYRKEKQKPAEF